MRELEPSHSSLIALSAAQTSVSELKLAVLTPYLMMLSLSNHGFPGAETLSLVVLFWNEQSFCFKQRLLAFAPHAEL